MQTCTCPVSADEQGSYTHSPCLKPSERTGSRCCLAEGGFLGFLRVLQFPPMSNVTYAIRARAHGRPPAVLWLFTVPIDKRRTHLAVAHDVD